MAGWIKMPLSREVGLCPNDVVLGADPDPLPKRQQSPPIFGPCLLWPDGWMDRYHLAWRWASVQATLC